MSIQSNIFNVLFELQQVIKADKDKQKYLKVVKAVGFDTVEEFLKFNYKCD